MNRIERKLQTLQEKNEKAFITYITAGLPDMEHCAKLIRAQEEAGLDILELGIPFSDPAADGSDHSGCVLSFYFKRNQPTQVLRSGRKRTERWLRTADRIYDILQHSISLWIG